MDNFLYRIECEMEWLAQTEEEKIEVLKEVATIAFQLGKAHESLYTEIVGDGTSNYMVFSNQPFTYTEAVAWLDWLAKHPEQAPPNKKKTDWKTQLVGLNGNRGKVWTVDEDFWVNVDFIRFHSEFLEISRLKGKPLYFLHDEFFQDTQDVNAYDGNYTFFVDIESDGIPKKVVCTHRFRKDAKELIDFLYDEAKERDLLNFDHLI